MQMVKGIRTALAGFAILVAGNVGAIAETDYPSKSIAHIMPWSAGGGTDTAMRTFLEYAKAPLGVDINTMNITGAQSGVGVLRLMNARPDGYTIGSLTWDSMITVPYFGLVPGYDTDRLSYLATVTVYPTLLVVNADTGWKTVEDFVEAAKANPGQITISNSGNAGIWHLHALDMADALGVKLNHVPFPDGSAPQREALISGENDAASISYAAIASAIDAGQVQALALMAEERDPRLPDVPTFKELGYDVIWGGLRVLAVPAETPQEIQDTLTKAFKTAFNNPEFQKKGKAIGLTLHWLNGKETEAYVKRMQERATTILDKLVEAGVIHR